jgi:predicted Rossmann fold nucleotide-binding protein DprA/Smf involved in DNA uptake
MEPVGGLMYPGPVAGTRVRRPIRIGVIGSAGASEEGAALARAIGRSLALAEAVVVCGGGTGVMEAVAEGAAAAGGTVLAASTCRSRRVSGSRGTRWWSRPPRR